MYDTFNKELLVSGGSRILERGFQFHWCCKLKTKKKSLKTLNLLLSVFIAFSHNKALSVEKSQTVLILSLHDDHKGRAHFQKGVSVETLKPP